MSEIVNGDLVSKLIHIAVFVTVMVILPCFPASAGEVGFIGLQVQGITKALAKTMGLDETGGVLVRDLDMGSPANKAGFRRGDLIVKFNGKKIDTIKQLVGAISTVKPGQKATATILRNTKSVKLEIKAVNRPKNRRITKGSFATIPEIGLTIAALTEKVRQGFGLRWSSVGVVITLLDKTKTKDMDLKRGEVITLVDQQNVWLPRQIVAKFQEAKKNGVKSLLLMVEGREGKRNGFRFSILPVR